MIPIRSWRFACCLLAAGGVFASEPQHGEELWWSLKPIVRPTVPDAPGDRATNPIDAFLQAKIAEHGLGFSPEADRRTLIRRVSFDLLGLPPAIEEVERFVSDPDPRAFEQLVERMLASPHYGERWARHWLDVVHYGDTHGYDKDQPRPNAWPYRDYVIRSFNEDKPYSTFVREQVAGDVIYPNSTDAIEALGFIAAGPWDLIGHAEVPESKIDGKIARHLDRDDMVSNTMSTFTSMTVHCAQCHDHKFDPIPAEDYYRLQAVFAALDRTEQEYYSNPELTRTRRELKAEERRLTNKRSILREEMRKQGGEAYGAMEKRVQAARKQGSRERPPEYGYHSEITASAEIEKWVQVDLGRRVQIGRVVLAPAWDDFAGIGAGFGFPVRFRIEMSDDPDFRSGVHIVHDQTGSDSMRRGIELQSFSTSGSARYVRVTATRLAPRQGDYIFALAELQVWSADPDAENLANGAAVTALDSIQSPPRWGRQNLTDGIFPAAAAMEVDVAAVEAEWEELAARELPAGLRAEWHQTTNGLASVAAELSAMPEPRRVFSGAIHYGSGAFRGTGPDGGKPRPIALLARGDVRSPVRPVDPGALSALSDLPARFDLPEGHPEGERRRALAEWLTDARNPLTWRSIVNRVWQYHFGRGLVDTPNDFGRMGALPSHPELLDWLASEFRDRGQSIKRLHWLIVTSRAYRQVSTVTDEQQRALELDQENRLLWRMNRRKLEAEAVRDAVLMVSGALRSEMFGPGFKDFVVEKPEHSPHYQYHLYDPADPASHRRSIYRFIVRSQQQPFMTALDCADPSMLVGKRNESLSALQALALLNNGFMVTMARRFAETVRAETENPVLEAQARRAFERALSRSPDEREAGELNRFAREHGLENLCRLLFNLNEFLFVD